MRHDPSREQTRLPYFHDVGGDEEAWAKGLFQGKQDPASLNGRFCIVLLGGSGNTEFLHPRLEGGGLKSEN